MGVSLSARFARKGAVRQAEFDFALYSVKALLFDDLFTDEDGLFSLR